MNNNEILLVPERIGYSFKDIRLLEQAFTRSSYAKEHPDVNNNEVLEFIGDKALDLVVINELIDFYSYCNDKGEFVCKEDEGKLTDIKKRLVDEEMLSHRIEILGFHEYLKMGKGDIINGVKNRPAVQCDLFESIVGAVAIDSNWDFNALKRVVDKMLDVTYYLTNNIVSEDNNYIGLVQEWHQKKFKSFPNYEFKEVNDNKKKEFVCSLSVKGIKKLFQASGSNKQDAKLKVAKALYEYINKKDVKKDNIKLVEKKQKVTISDNPISDLTRLVQKNKIQISEFTYTHKKEKGELIWVCNVNYNNKTFKGSSTSKKEAKKIASIEVLKEYNN